MFLFTLRPLRGLQETRVATREESGVLGFPSRRGLTPRVGGRRKAVRDRLALQGGTGDFPCAAAAAAHTSRRRRRGHHRGKRPGAPVHPGCAPSSCRGVVGTGTEGETAWGPRPGRWGHGRVIPDRDTCPTRPLEHLDPGPHIPLQGRQGSRPQGWHGGLVSDTAMLGGMKVSERALEQGLPLTKPDLATVATT